MITSMTFRRGAPVTIGERIISGDILPGHTMRARMKRAPANGSLSMPGEEISVVIPAFASTFVPAASDVAAHYLHSLTAEQSMQIDDGVYIFDSALLLNDEVLYITDPIKLVISNSASG